MKRAAIYLRVSDEGQVGRAFSVEGYSIENQREVCHRRAAQLELEVVDEYVDYAKTARVARRPQFQKLLQRIRGDRDIDVVIVYNVSRFARNVYDDAVIGQELDQLGVEFVSATEHFDSSPFGKRMRRYAAADAEFYSEELAFKVKNGLHRKAQHGGTPAVAPTGYLNVGRVENFKEVRVVEPDPERAHHFTWAFTAFATGGYTVDALLASVTARGLTTRPTRRRPARPLSRTQLYRALKNPYYMGVVRYGGVDYEGRHEPLTDKKTFEQVQRVLQAHSQAGDRDRKHSHFLKGSLWCQCGSRISYQRVRSKTGQPYFYFYCIGRAKGTGCTQPYLTPETVERLVAREYHRVKFRHGTRSEEEWLCHLDIVRHKLTEALAGMRKLALAEVDRLKRRISALGAESQKLLQAYYADALPLELLKSEQARLQSELSQAEHDLDGAERAAAELDTVVDRAIAFIGRVEDGYQKVDDTTRRIWNQSLFDGFVVTDEDITAAELSEPFRSIVEPERLTALINALKPAKRRRHQQNRTPDPEAALFSAAGFEQRSTLPARRVSFKPVLTESPRRASARNRWGASAAVTARMPGSSFGSSSSASTLKCSKKAWLSSRRVVSSATA